MSTMADLASGNFSDAASSGLSSISGGGSPEGLPAPSGSLPGASSITYPAAAIHFGVTIDGVGALSFTRCEGLSAQFDMFEWAEGGRNSHNHMLPGRMTYGPVTLTRPIDASSGRLAAWFTTVTHYGPTPNTMKVTAYYQLKPIAEWHLVDAWPQAYSGPVFDINDENIATESLTVVHHGFTRL